MNFIISLRSELLKTKRTTTFYLCLLTAGFIPILFLLEHSLGSLEPETLKNPWHAFFNTALEAFGLVILPFYVILTSTLLPQLEYRNNAWKQVLVSPETKTSLFLSKFLIFQFFILLAVLLFAALMITSAGLAQLTKPEVVFFSQNSNWSYFFTTLLDIYISVVAISAFQFWMGMRFKNFITPIGIGFAGYILAALLLFEVKWELADTFPFTYPFLNIFKDLGTNTAFWKGSALGYTVLFLLLGYIDFIRKVHKV
jgi:hypothetical protein